MRKIFLFISVLSLILLGGCKKTEIDPELGEIDVTEETEVQEESIPVLIEKPTDINKAGKFEMVTTFKGETAYNPQYNFGINYDNNTKTKEMSVIITVPEKLLEITRVNIIDKNNKNVDSKIESPFYYDAYRISGKTKKYICLHLVYDANIDLRDYKIRISNNWNLEDEYIVDFNESIGEVPNDLKEVSMNLNGNLFAYINLTYVSNEEYRHNVKDNYLAVFTPLNCSASKFDDTNLNIKVNKEFDKMAKNNLEIKLIGKIDSIEASDYDGLGCSILTPSLKIQMDYDCKKFKDEFGYQFGSELYSYLNNIDIYNNGDKVFSLKKK